MTSVAPSMATGRTPARAWRIAAGPERLRFAAEDRSAFERYNAFYAIGSDTNPLSDGFTAAVSCVRLDRMMVHDRRVVAAGHGRGPDRVRRDALSHFTVTICLAGTMFGAGAQGFRQVRPGEIWLTDMARPVETRIEDARLLTLGVGRELIEATGRAADLHATVLAAARAAPLTRALLDLVDRGGALSTADAALAAQSIPRLVGVALGAGPMLDPRRLDRMARTRRLIDAWLGRPDLDADLIAGELNLSRSTVYRLFEPAGGVGRFVRARRLERLRRLLAERAVDASIADLAELVGFASESHASRLFLSRYGLRPGAFRAEARQSSDFATGMIRLSGWVEELQ